MEVIPRKAKLSKLQSTPANFVDCRSEDKKVGYDNGVNSSKDRIFDMLSLKSKSMEDKLDKLCSSNHKEGNSQMKNNKSIFKGHKFCMDPEQMGFRLKKMSGKKTQEEEMLEKRFLGFSLSRPTPQVRLNNLNNLLSSLTSPDDDSTPLSLTDAKNQRLISKHLCHLRISVCGDKGEKVLNDKEHASLTDVMVKSGFISMLVMKIPLLGFEERKTACLIWCNLFRRPVSEGPMVTYLEGNPKLLFSLLDGYHNQSLALTTGRMLRECIRYEPLAKLILYSEYFYEIFEFLKTSTFETSSDAFITFQAILMEHKKQSAEYIKENFNKFFTNYDKLLTCDNYVTQVGSLRFLSRLLLERQFYDLMRQYVQDGANLKRIILLMTSSSGNIQLEGFHILKIFIADPDPAPQVKSIFTKNKDRLIRLITMINGEKYGETFGEEKAYVIKQLKDLSKRHGSGVSSVTGSSTDDTDG